MKDAQLAADLDLIRKNANGTCALAESIGYLVAHIERLAEHIETLDERLDRVERADERLDDRIATLECWRRNVKDER
jgi:hypothetical protein